MKHDCQQHELLREMHGDIRTLLSEFKAMNGSLRDTKHDFEKHQEDSRCYRKKIDELWTVIHTVKYAIGLLFGAGLVWKIIEWVAR